MSQLFAEQNAVIATKQLLQLCDIPVTQTGLSKALKQHPDFPSLNAVSEVLTDYKVPNLATRLNPERLFEVPLPAMFCIEENDRLFAPVRTVGEQITWWHSQRGWQTDNFQDFIRKWTGVALLIEPLKNAGEPNFDHNRRQENLKTWRWIFILTVSTGLIGALSWHWLQKLPFITNVYYYSLLGINLIGVLVSALLVWYGIDTQNAILQRVCQFNNRTNCQHILQSPAAKVSDWLSWSEVGLFYFAGCILYLLIQPHRPILLWGLNALGLPYTIWSVYFQWRVERKWCVLCMTVQVLLWASFFTATYWLWDIGSVISVQLRDLITLAIAFAPTPVIWSLLRSPLHHHAYYHELQQNFNRLKFDPDYLQSLMSRPRVLPPIFEGMNPISLGNSTAEHQLIVVINPTCSSCRRNHNQLHQLISQHPNVYIQIIFAANLSDDDVAGKVARQILSLPLQQQEAALERWFSFPESRYRQWAETTPGDYYSETAVQQLSFHLRWLELAGVSSAPVAFLNQVELPQIYLTSDYRRLLSFISAHGIGQFI